jgi:hypothetical protein
MGVGLIGVMINYFIIELKWKMNLIKWDRPNRKSKART